MRSSTDIVSISTGRETILIGPLSAFGAQAASVVLRDRFSIIQALEFFASRPNAEQLVRPHLRRWGVDPLSLRVATRQTMVHALAQMASNGTIGISKVPDITLSFAGASLDEEFKQVSVKPITGGALPPDLSDRMMLVFEMAPQYMEGETRMAFDNAVKDLGMGLIVGAVVTWVGAHFIPGVNIAMLAFDLFFLSTAVLHALERAHEIVGEVRDAKSRAELKPAAIAMAAVLSILIVEGVLGRLLKAKSLTKGVGKQGGHSDAKPSVKKKEETNNRQPATRIRTAALLPMPARTESPKCQALSKQRKAIEKAQENAALANAAYEDPNGAANLPNGWQRASDEDMEDLGLLVDGANLTEMESHPDFRADVFSRMGADGEKEYTISYRGTDPTQINDWEANIQQARGKETAYYSQAMLIAIEATNLKPGRVQLVGHSLGGGMASSASVASGAPATTYNAAGVHPNTIKNYPGKLKNAPIDAYYVKGDVLSGVQDKSLGAIPDAIGKRLSLSPANGFATSDALGGFAAAALAMGPGGVIGGAALARGIRLHSMKSMDASLEKAKHNIEAEQAENGCN